jgi:hypothetical protein
MLYELAQDRYIFISKCLIRRYQQTKDFLGFNPLSRKAFHFMGDATTATQSSPGPAHGFIHFTTLSRASHRLLEAAAYSSYFRKAKTTWNDISTSICLA